MELSAFIRENEEEILQEWEDFARKLSSAPAQMNAAALRDHARGMLLSIADDLAGSNEHHNERQGASSAQGEQQSAAEAHGVDRSDWGFSVIDMMAEFRALRATVIRLWGERTERISRKDLARFNEALDQVLTESVDRYTAQKEQQQRLLETMLSYSADQSYIFDTKGNLLYANRAMAQAYGLHPHDIIGKSVDELDPAFAAEVHRQIGQVLETRREYRGDFTANTATGEVHVIEYLFAPILDENGNIEAITGNSRDITARKAWEHTLWRHANHDHLTGVPNRRLFLDRLEQDIRFARRTGELLAVFYIDLDKFKAANDRLGHEGGDALLKQTAERIQSCIRETDTLARMGGDEFAVVLTAAGDEDHVQGVARAILARLSRPFSINDETVRIAGSIGIALYPEHGAGADELLAHADEAMYAIKHAGGDGYEFSTTVQRLHTRQNATGAQRSH